MRIRTVGLTVAVVAGTALLSIVLSPAVRDAGSPTLLSAGAGRPTQVGALFAISPDGKLGAHFCTASVVDSPHGNLVLTAAHCLSNRSAAGVAFVPAFDNGKEPFGIWTVTRILVDQNWQSSADPNDDFAFLIVTSTFRTAGVQQLTGAEALGIGAPAGTTVTVDGYPSDLNAEISCQNTAQAFGATQLEFDCAGYTDGTSGSPLLTPAGAPNSQATVIGVIGGYQQGGDTPAVSYAARFGASMAALYNTAVADSAP